MKFEFRIKIFQRQKICCLLCVSFCHFETKSCVKIISTFHIYRTEVLKEKCFHGKKCSEKMLDSCFKISMYLLEKCEFRPAHFSFLFAQNAFEKSHALQLSEYKIENS